MAISTPTMDTTTTDRTTTMRDRKAAWGSWGAIIVVAFLVFAAILLMNRPTDTSGSSTMMEGQTTSDSVSPAPAPMEVPADNGASREIPAPNN